MSQRGFSGVVTQELHKAERLAVREHMQAVDLYGGLVAQLVEQRIENPRVGGSIPPQATKIPEWNQRVSGLGL